MYRGLLIEHIGRSLPTLASTDAFPPALSLLERTKQVEGNVVLKRKRKNRFKF